MSEGVKHAANARGGYSSPNIGQSVARWQETQPPNVVVLSEKFPPDTCYRVPGVVGLGEHVTISAYVPRGEDRVPNRVVIVEGRDSLVPGRIITVFVALLQECGCGSWSEATPEQRKNLGTVLW